MIDKNILKSLSCLFLLEAKLKETNSENEYKNIYCYKKKSNSLNNINNLTLTIIKKIIMLIQSLIIIHVINDKIININIHFSKNRFKTRTILTV